MGTQEPLLAASQSLEKDLPGNKLEETKCRPENWEKEEEKALATSLVPPEQLNGQNYAPGSQLEKHQCTHPSTQPFVCSDCGSSFTMKKNLTRHRRTHTGEKPYNCADCGKSFSQSGDLTRHKRTHSSEKPYPCADCGKSFSSSSSYLHHLLVHTGEKPYRCSVCGKSFRRNSNLSEHMYTHTDTKSYHCNDCGKSFTRSSHLKHLRSHSGEKPYPCSVCGKSFRDSYSYLHHCLVHTGEKPYQCSVCGKSFRRNSNLREHMRTHTGKKPYHCSDCGKSFTLRGNLTKHKRRQHGEKVFAGSETRPSVSAPVSSATRGPAVVIAHSCHSDIVAGVDRRCCSSQQGASSGFLLLSLPVIFSSHNGEQILMGTPNLVHISSVGATGCDTSAPFLNLQAETLNGGQSRADPSQGVFAGGEGRQHDVSSCGTRGAELGKSLSAPCAGMEEGGGAGTSASCCLGIAGRREVSDVGGKVPFPAD